MGLSYGAMLNVLGVLGILVFCAVVILLAAAITWLVVKVSPTRSKKPEPTAGA